MSKIKILIGYHKPATLFKDEILTPIHLGRANVIKADDESTKWMLENMIGDDTGVNISHKNSLYNEMTGLYWAWKNYDQLNNPDYIGLMHYRRHFVYREGEIKVYEVNDFDEKYYLDEINYSVEEVKKLVSKCDFIAHIGRVNNVYKHYIENHKKEDLDLAFKIMIEKYPDYWDVAEKYLAEDYSNFGNMFILSKKLFFDYCEWIFDILAEFENQVDCSEKRMFISERLSGVFIANLMKQKQYKHKILPMSFIVDSIAIPIVMPYNRKDAMHTAVSVYSILQNEKNKNVYKFYFLCDYTIDEVCKDKMRNIVKDYPLTDVQFMKYDGARVDAPACVAELLPQENKVLYLDGICVAMQGIGEFIRDCSVDDYFMVGLPLHENNPYERHKKITTEILVLNCNRLRRHRIWDKYQDSDRGELVLSGLCEGEVGYIPWYFVTREKELLRYESVYKPGKMRVEEQVRATWCAWLVYDKTLPWENSQGVYSIYWWRNFRKIGRHFPFIDFSYKEIEKIYKKQQIEINCYNEELEISSGSEERELTNHIGEAEVVYYPKEIWREYSMFGKLYFFYKHNGFKQTVMYSTNKVINKVFAREGNK